MFNHRFFRCSLLTVGVIAVLLLGGCGPPAKLDLFQPRLSGFQQNLNLRSERACWSPGDQADRVLVEFPPTGASTGRRNLFLLYFRVPKGQDTPLVGGGPKPYVRGFFIQTRGRYAGLVTVVSGTMAVHGSTSGPNAHRRFEFELICEDGARLVGEVDAKRDDVVLKQFETYRRPVDVQNLISGASTKSAATGS